MGPWAIRAGRTFQSPLILPSCSYMEKWRLREGEDWPGVTQEVRDDNGVTVGKASFHIRHC